jgi:hypothetical protein
MDMDPRTKGLLKQVYYVDTADEVYFTYSITNDSSSVFFPHRHRRPAQADALAGSQAAISFIQQTR